MINYLYALLLDWFKFLWFVVGNPLKFLASLILTLFLIYTITRLVSRGFFLSKKEVDYEWENKKSSKNN